MERRIICPFLALLIIVTGFAPELAYGKDRVVGWRLESDGAGYCLLLSEYRIGGHPEIDAAIAMTVTDDFRAFRLHVFRADFDLSVGSVYDVVVSIDKRWAGQGIVEVPVSDIFGLGLPLTHELLDALMRGSSLSVHGRRSTVSILLTGTRTAIPALLDCVAGRPGRRGINPFDAETGTDDMM